MKKPMLVALCALAVACGGGGGGIDPTKVTFTYPAPSAPVAGSPASNAAAVGETGLSDASTIKDASTSTEADAKTQSIVSLPEDIATAATEVAVTAVDPVIAQKVAALASTGSGYARKAIAAGLPRAQQAFDPGCVVVTPGSITYNNCVDTVTNTTARVNGTLTRTIGPTQVVLAWDLTVSATFTDPTPPATTITVGAHYTGQLTLDASTIVGASRSDTTVAVSSQLQAGRFGVTHLASYDLDYGTAPFCLTGGTIEVRRVWTERPAGAQGDLNVGVKFTFGPACGDVLVSFGQ